MDGFQRLPLDTLKLLFCRIDISVTAARVEAKYVNSGKGRPRYPVRSMLLALLFMRFEAIPSLRKLCRKLERRQYAREICEFTLAPKHNTFSLFISRAGPDTIEGLFTELRDQAFNMRIVDRDGAVKVRMHVAICFTCIYAVAILAHSIGRPELANSIAAFTY